MDPLGPYASLSLASSLYIPNDDAAQPNFVNLDAKYTCLICGKLLREPVQTLCGHRMCRSCVESRLEEVGDAGFHCPAKEEDCELITKDKVNPDFSVMREINVLEVHCTNLLHGCQETMQLRRLKNHIPVCKFRPVICSFQLKGCNEISTPDTINEHEASCPYRMVTCEHCHRSIKAMDLMKHVESECPDVIIDCPYKCGATGIRRLNLDDHLQSCPSCCKYHAMGCRKQGTAEELAEHERNASSEHLDLVLLRLAKLQLENTRLRNSLERLTEDLDPIRTRYAEQMRENETLQKKIDALTKDLKDHQQKSLKMLASQNEKILQMEEKCKAFDAIARELPSIKQKQVQIDENIRSVETTGGGAAQLPVGLQTQFNQHDQTIGMHDVRLAEMDLRLQCIETTNYEGYMIWKISDYTRRKREATTGGNVSLYSQPFFSGRYGYKMCARIYLNGDGAGRGSHISLFFVLMQGDYDDILPWPFRLRVTMTLIDQRHNRRHLSDSFRPDPTSSSFQKPNSPMNVASGCPLFVPHRTLEPDNPENFYLKDDSLFFKISVDTAEFHGP